MKYPKIQNWDKYKSIRTQLDCEAMDRDNNKCVGCGETKALEVHHKVPKIESLDNLITLCHKCHKKEHNMSGCFTSEFNESRVKTQFKKGEYFNRWTGEWVGR